MSSIYRLFSRTGRSGPASASTRADLWSLAEFFAMVLIIENVVVLFWAFSVRGVPGAPGQQTYGIAGVWGIAMLCSGAASWAGGLIGFLFAIPRAADDRGNATTAAAGAGLPGQHTPNAQPSHTQVEVTTVHPSLRANTNLESISDGLTKVLLGVGLAQLGKIGGWMSKAATVLGPSFGPDDSGAVAAISILLYGGFGGFFFGYLATRIYLTGVFLRTDPH